MMSFFTILCSLAALIRFFAHQLDFDKRRQVQVVGEGAEYLKGLVIGHWSPVIGC